LAAGSALRCSIQSPAPPSKPFAFKPLFSTRRHYPTTLHHKKSFGYDPLQCPRCGRILELAEIWEPKRGHNRFFTVLTITHILSGKSQARMVVVPSCTLIRYLCRGFVGDKTRIYRKDYI